MLALHMLNRDAENQELSLVAYATPACKVTQSIVLSLSQGRHLIFLGFCGTFQNRWCTPIKKGTTLHKIRYCLPASVENELQKNDTRNYQFFVSFPGFWHGLLVFLMSAAFRRANKYDPYRYYIIKFCEKTVQAFWQLERSIFSGSRLPLARRGKCVAPHFLQDLGTPTLRHRAIPPFPSLPRRPVSAK